MSRYRYEFDSSEQFPDRRRDRRAKNMPLCWLNANRVIINMQNERKDIDR